MSVVWLPGTSNQQPAAVPWPLHLPPQNELGGPAEVSGIVWLPGSSSTCCRVFSVLSSPREWPHSAHPPNCTFLFTHRPTDSCTLLCPLHTRRHWLHSEMWWPKLFTAHGAIAWDDYEKDYSDLPSEVLERHRCNDWACAMLTKAEIAAISCGAAPAPRLPPKGYPLPPLHIPALLVDVLPVFATNRLTEAIQEDSKRLENRERTHREQLQARTLCCAVPRCGVKFDSLLPGGRSAALAFGGAQSVTRRRCRAGRQHKMARWIVQLTNKRHSREGHEAVSGAAGRCAGFQGEGPGRLDLI